MDIGLQGTLSITSRGHGRDAGVWAMPGLSPIGGILDAPNVVILGASIMEAAFGNDQVLRPELQAYAQAAGFTGTLHARAQSGERIAQTRARLAAARAEPALAGTAGQNLYLVHTGGNDVSGHRPWPGGEADFAAAYQALIQDIVLTDRAIPLPLTKRLYGKSAEPPFSAPHSVDPADPATQVNGARPYNEAIIHPAIAQFAPAWWSDGQGPHVDPYELADRYPQLLGADGIHGYAAALGRFILARIAGRARGSSPAGRRAGRGFLYSPQKGEPNAMSIGTVNRFLSYGSGAFQNNPLLCGAVDTEGMFDPFLEVLTNDVFQNGSKNAGTGTYARIPDARFHSTDIVNRGIYVQGSQVYALTFAGLVPGDWVRVSAVGVRNAGGNGRRARLHLSTGQTLELNASNAAASNQVTFAPVPVPADGRLELSVSVAPGSQYGYLHGVLLDFSD